jgi:hypothetical protein
MSPQLRLFFPVLLVCGLLSVRGTAQELPELPKIDPRSIRVQIPDRPAVDSGFLSFGVIIAVWLVPTVIYYLFFYRPSGDQAAPPRRGGLKRALLVGGILAAAMVGLVVLARWWDARF